MATGDITAAAVALTDADYVLLADGATVATLGIQLNYSGGPIRVAFAAAKPAVDVTTYIVLGGSTPPFREVLSAGTKVWGLPLFAGNAVARVYKVER